ncbi:MAG: hypothetical protein GX909_00135 [Clostridiaceae bacterium]|mgnify:CR=1 FL=1|nr:hypothetical protein [Clostridiaceae bacterium]
MIEAVVGSKGSGKTSIIVDEINRVANSKDNNIVCIEYGKRFNQQIPYQVRLIDIMEYPVKTYRELLTFIAGVCAQDHDISHFYIDSLYKIANSTDIAALEVFFNDLNELTKNISAKFTITISDDPEKMPENVKKVMR